MQKSNYMHRSRSGSSFRSNKSRFGTSSPRRSNKRGQSIDPRRFVKSAQPIEQLVYTPHHGFADFELHPLLKNNLAARGYHTPTQIQDKSIPLVLQGKDVIGIANTGTGKTAAFVLPLLNKLMAHRDQKALIVAPTRELAQQIEEELRQFAKGSGLSGVVIIGGVPIGPQIRQLRERQSVIIGTPGRIKDHVTRGTLQLSTVSTVVLDEVDRMLDMGFVKDVRVILHSLPPARQSLFFSATISPGVGDLIREFAHAPISIMAKTSETGDHINQSVIQYLESAEKIDKLHELLLAEHVGKILIFGETKRSVDRLSKELVNRGFLAEAMHGDKTQAQRQRALRNFRENHITILVATDVAARGIDVDGITHVINYDLPQTFDDYTHRIGRAGRAGNIGQAVTFVPRVLHNNTIR